MEVDKDYMKRYCAEYVRITYEKVTAQCDPNDKYMAYQVEVIGNGRRIVYPVDAKLCEMVCPQDPVCYALHEALWTFGEIVGCEHERYLG